MKNTMVDRILRLKSEREVTNTLELYESVKEEIATSQLFLEDQNQRYAEDQEKIEDLTNQLSTLKVQLAIEEQNLESKVHELEKHNETLRELETEKKKVVGENLQLESKRNCLRNTKPSITDQRLLDLGKKKYNLYKNFTGIRWDYSVQKEFTKGYVNNKRDYIHAFCYNNKQDSQKLCDLVWQEIYLSTVPKAQGAIEGKENVTPNT